MSETLQLSGELVSQVQDMLAAHDERCQDPLVAVQYLAAVSGYVLGCQPIPAHQRDAFLDQLAQFMRQVHDDVASQSAPPPAQAPAGEAFGVWQPGDP